MVDSRQHRRQRSVNVSGTKAASIYPWSQLGHRRNWKLKWRRSHVVLRVKIWLLGPCPGTSTRMVKHGSAHFCCKANMIRHVGSISTIIYIYILILLLLLLRYYQSITSPLRHALSTHRNSNKAEMEK